eukprot:7353096-Pyramimonas_sp.AAC.2
MLGAGTNHTQGGGICLEPGPITHREGAYACSRDQSRTLMMDSMMESGKRPVMGSTMDDTCMATTS